jgi:hypothetical protein
MNESTVPDARLLAPSVASCSSTDHDGVQVPAAQRVIAHHADGRRVETERCSYCAEGLVARMLRDGWVVTTWTTKPPATVPPTDGGETAEAGHPQAGPAVTSQARITVDPLQLTVPRSYVVAAVRGGRPVFAEGFSAHTDTVDEASEVATVWRRIGETVKVFELVEVTL